MRCSEYGLRFERSRHDQIGTGASQCRGAADVRGVADADGESFAHSAVLCARFFTLHRAARRLKNEANLNYPLSIRIVRILIACVRQLLLILLTKAWLRSVSALLQPLRASERTVLHNKTKSLPLVVFPELQMLL